MCMFRRISGIAILLVVVLFTAFSAHCGEKKASEIVIGYWKMDSDSNTVFLEITKDYLRNPDRKQPVDIAIDDRDGRAVIRLAGRDIVAAVVTVESEDRVIMHDQGSNARDPFVRISKEEFEAAIPQ